MEPKDGKVVKALVANHERFLRFLMPKVGSREAAEDILQAAFVKGIQRGGGLRKDESAVAWFFRILRNAVTDHFRRNAVERKARESSKRKAEPPTDEQVERAVCACVKGLIGTLKPEYAEILRKVDVDGARVDATAKAMKITPNNAMARLHRARQALHSRLVQSCGTCTEHGCLDCHCRA